jgi:phosphate transport system substrate-binding protein
MSKKQHQWMSPPPIVFILIGIGLLTSISKWLPKKDLSASSAINIIKQKPATPQSTLISSVSNVQGGTFKYSGSTTWAELRKDLHPVIELAFPQFKLQYVNPEDGIPSSEKGIDMLLEQQVDFVQSSKGIPADQLQKAKQKGIQLKNIPIARSGFAIAVHPDLNIAGITLDEYQRIMTGDIQNWQAIGGPDLPIHIYSTEDKTSGYRSFTIVKNATEAFRRISQDPGGLHIASVALVVPQCGVKALSIGLDQSHLISPYQEPLISASNCSQKHRNRVDITALQTKSYPLIRDLSVVIIADGGAKQALGESYARMLLTEQGQELIQKVGYLNYR